MCQRFGECLAEWMEQNALTPAMLAEKTGYKSRTTVTRFLNGHCGYDRCRQYLTTLGTAFDLREEWKERFRGALLAEKYGRERYMLYRAIYSQMIENRGYARPEKEAEVPGEANGEMLILGCPWKETFDLIFASLDRHPKAGIRHYLTEKELMSSPDLFRGTTALLKEDRYTAYLVPEAARESSVWNMVWSRAGDGREQARAGLNGSFVPFPGETEAGAFSRISQELSSGGTVSLYRFGHLETGTDYVRFLNECLNIEKNRETLIVKPTPGIQMIPVGITMKGLDRFFREKGMFMVAEMGEGVSALSRRVDQFFHRKERTRLVFSWDCLCRFAQRGKLADQLYLLRPFSPPERKKILSGILEFAREGNCEMYLLREDTALPLSYEIYSGKGTVIYPSNTSYYTPEDPYREIFVPGKGVEGLLWDFTFSALLPARAMDRQESLRRLETLVRQMPGE